MEAKNQDRLLHLINRRKKINIWCRFTIPLAIIDFLCIPNLTNKNDDIIFVAWFFSVISILLSGVFFVKITFRTLPRTVLLLRPFEEGLVSNSLNSLIAKEISFIGMTFTLSDNYIKNPVPWWYHIFTFIARLGGPLLAWMSIAFPSINYRNDINKLSILLNSPFRLSWLWVFSKNRLLIIPSSNNFWRDTINLLLQSVDCVIVDLSTIGVGTVWELHQLKQKSSLRVIFIASQGHIRDAQEIVLKFFPSQIEHFFGYRPDGSFVRRQDFLRVLDRWFTN